MRVLLIIGGIVLISAGVFGMASGMFNLGSSFQSVVDSAVQGPQAEDLCKPGETLEQENGQSEYTPGQGNAHSVRYYCVDSSGVRREVTGDFAQDLLSGVSNIFPSFSLRLEYVALVGGGILLLLIGIFSGLRRGVDVRPGVAISSDPSSAFPMSGQPVVVRMQGQNLDLGDIIQQAQAMKASSGSINSGDDLLNKLRQLEEARRANLISQEEYDRLRQQILDSMK
jgi:hypothetical protein